MKNVLVMIILFTLGSCSMNSKQSGSDRSVANTGIMKRFIGEVAGGSEKYVARELEDELEKRLKAFLAKSDAENYARMGITKDQAKNINGLYDDLPYMNKVQKWVMENITILMKEIQPSIARNAYSKILGNSSTYNPYKSLVDNANNTAINRRNTFKPTSVTRTNYTFSPMSVADEIANKNRQLVNYTQKLKSEFKGVTKKSQENIIKSLDMTDDFIKRNPASATNIHHSGESSITVLNKTGKGPGVGCSTFNKKASSDVLDIKSRIDMVRAQKIEQKAYDKAGKQFKNVDEVADDLRLTQKEIDNATEEAFEDVLGYTSKESKAAVKRLKTPPCQVY